MIPSQIPEPRLLERVSVELGADSGENATIALGLELEATIVLDDLKARRYASGQGLSVVGTLGILILIHQLRMANRVPEAELALLEPHGMWLSESLRRRVLQGLKAN